MWIAIWLCFDLASQVVWEFLQWELQLCVRQMLGIGRQCGEFDSMYTVQALDSLALYPP